MTAYRELFRLSIEHAYYEGRPLPDCRIVPAGRTGALMERTGMIMRRLPDAVVFLMPADRIDLLRSDVRESGDDFPFLLCVHAGDPLLACCTAPSTPPGMLLLADSRRAVADPSAGPAGSIRLHPGDRLGAESLAADEDPLCALALAGTSSPVRPFLVVNIALSSEASGFPGDGGEPAARAFVVRLDAGASHWKYYLLGALAERDLAVTDLDGTVAFRRAGDASFDSRRATVFVSERAIGLRARPGARFQLLENTPFGEKILMKRMPVACAGIRQKAEFDGQAVQVSEIFINY
jgi:hypothetical protein